MIALIVFVLALLGFAALAVSMRRHQNVVKQLVQHRKSFQITGWALLSASLLMSLMQPQKSIAFVEWFFLLTAAGIPIVTAVTFAQFRQPKNKNAR